MKKLLQRLAKKIEQMSEVKVGTEEGEICNRKFCLGIMVFPEGSCSCSTCGHPPCGYCESGAMECDTCGWEEG